MIGVAFSLALALEMPQAVDPEARARQFLDAFAENPKTARQFATKDAAVIVGDIGGTYAQFLKVMRRYPNMLKDCRIAELSWKQDLSAEEQRNPDLDPRLKTGKIRAFAGAYNCPRAGGSKGEVEYTVVLRDDRVVEFFLGGDR